MQESNGSAPVRDVASIAAISIAIGVTLLAWAIVIYFYHENFGSTLSGEHEKWGQFGDYVGGLLNPLLGTLTLFGVLYTVRLQRDVLRVSRDQLDEAAHSVREATHAAKVQRLLSEQQSFETGFFQLLESVNQHARRSFVSLRPSDFDPPNAGTQHSSSGAQLYTDQNVFSSVIRAIGLRFGQSFDRGDVLDRSRGDYLRSAAETFFVTHDNGLGPFLRSMADLFEYIEDHDHRLASTLVGDGLLTLGVGSPGWPAPGVPSVQGPEFYARVATNNRTRYEMKVFAMYVASRQATERIRGIAQKWSIFDQIVDAEWWGRGPFIQMQDYTDGIRRPIVED